ncbi:MAG TPA: YqcC family protein [Pseudomonas sp.]|jgi:uncharacterized protein YqcC (DUF446 family)|nr:YqcC family protein [Pseudomonas sp.]
MDSRAPAVAGHLLLIERELRVLGWWSNTSPSEHALSSQQPFCVDTLELHQWLQWIFLPRMKMLVENGQPLPAVSGIRELAEMVYAERIAEVRTLLAVLSDFDRLITTRN